MSLKSAKKARPELRIPTAPRGSWIHGYACAKHIKYTG